MARSRRQRQEQRERVSARRRVEEHQSGFQSTVFRAPDGMGFFKPDKAGVKRIDVMSYRVGEGNPFADKGQLHYERTFYTHPGIGPNENTFICPAKTFNKPCPICEHRSKLARDPAADQEAVKKLLPKERQLFLVKDMEGDDKILLWEVSFHLFGKLLDNRIKTADEDDDYEFFADPEEGLTLRLTIEEKQFGRGRPFYGVEAIDFKPRKKNYTLEFAESMPCLDDLLIETGYDELSKIFFEGDVEPLGKLRHDDDDDDDDDILEDDDDDEDDEVVEEKPKRQSRRTKQDSAKEKPSRGKGKTKKEPEPDDDDWDDDDWDDEDDVPFDDKDEKVVEEKPKKSSKSSKPAKGKKEKPAPEPEPEDDDDDDDDEWDEDWDD